MPSELPDYYWDGFEVFEQTKEGPLHRFTLHTAGAYVHLDEPIDDDFTSINAPKHIKRHNAKVWAERVLEAVNGAKWIKKPLRRR